MTTVAWDGRVLAVDSQATSGCGTKTTTAKMRTGTWQDRDAAYAGVGSRAEADEIADWLFNRGDKPTLDDDSTHGILATYGQAYFVEGKRPRFIPMMDQFQALGTGRETALGAMHCGSSAEGAVNIAIRVDVYSGGVVQTHQPADSPRAEEVVDVEAYRRLKIMYSVVVAEVWWLKEQIQRERRTNYRCIGDGCDETIEEPTMCPACVRKMQCDRDDQLKLNATVADERARIRTSVGYYEMQGPEQLDQAFAFADVVDYFQKAVALVSSNVGAESPTLVSVLETTSRWEDPFLMEPGHEPVTDLDRIMMDRAEADWTTLGPLLPSGDAVRP